MLSWLLEQPETAGTEPRPQLHGRKQHDSRQLPAKLPSPGDALDAVCTCRTRKGLGLAVWQLWRRSTGCSGSTRVCCVGRDRSFTARHGGSRCDWPLAHGSLTFMKAPAADVTVRLMAVSVSSSDLRDRLLTLQCGRIWRPTGSSMTKQAPGADPSTSFSLRCRRTPHKPPHAPSPVQTAKPTRTPSQINQDLGHHDVTPIHRHLLQRAR